MPHHGFQAGMQTGASAYFTVDMSGKNMIFRGRDRAWLLQVHRSWVYQRENLVSVNLLKYFCGNLHQMMCTNMKNLSLNQLQHKKRWKSRTGSMWPFFLLEFYMWKNQIDVDIRTQRATWEESGDIIVLIQATEINFLVQWFCKVLRIF